MKTTCLNHRSIRFHWIRIKKTIHLILQVSKSQEAQREALLREESCPREHPSWKWQPRKKLNLGSMNKCLFCGIPIFTKCFEAQHMFLEFKQRKKADRQLSHNQVQEGNMLHCIKCNPYSFNKFASYNRSFPSRRLHSTIIRYKTIEEEEEEQIQIIDNGKSSKTDQKGKLINKEQVIIEPALSKDKKRSYNYSVRLLWHEVFQIKRTSAINGMTLTTLLPHLEMN